MVPVPNGTGAKWYRCQMVPVPNGTSTKWYRYQMVPVPLLPAILAFKFGFCVGTSFDTGFLLLGPPGLY